MTRESPASRARRMLADRGIARARELAKAGVTRTQIRRLLEQGVVERVGRGLYRDSEGPVTEHADLMQAAARVSEGVVCLLSALRFHGLTTVNPFEVWLALPHKAWRPVQAHPPMRFVYLSGRALEAGLERHNLEGAAVRVFSPAKTVADCFKFRSKLGTEVAVEALKAFRQAHPKELEELWRCAEIDRVGRVLRPYLEALGLVRW